MARKIEIQHFEASLIGAHSIVRSGTIELDGAGSTNPAAATILACVNALYTILCWEVASNSVLPIDGIATHGQVLGTPEILADYCGFPNPGSTSLLDLWMSLSGSIGNKPEKRNGHGHHV